MKKRYLLTAVIGIAAAMIMPSVPVHAEDLEEVRLRLAWVSGGGDAPAFVAQAKGYFAEHGLNVDIVDGNGSVGTIQAVGSGDFEFGIAGLGALAQAQQAAGADTLIAVAGLLQKDPSSIVSLKGSGINEPKDIEGRRLGIEASNFEDGMIKAFAEANDVDLDKVEVIIINGGADRIALLKGDVDFVNLWADPTARELADHAELEPPMLFADYGVNVLGSSVVVRKDYLAENPEIVRGFLAALQKGKAATVADSEAALQIIMDARPDNSEADVARELQNMPLYEHTKASAGMPYGTLVEEDILLTISLLERYAGMEPGLTPDMIYDGSYLPEGN